MSGSGARRGRARAEMRTELSTGQVRRPATSSNLAVECAPPGTRSSPREHARQPRIRDTPTWAAGSRARLREGTTGLPDARSHHTGGSDIAGQSGAPEANHMVLSDNRTVPPCSAAPRRRLLGACEGPRSVVPTPASRASAVCCCRTDDSQPASFRCLSISKLTTSAESAARSR